MIHAKGGDVLKLIGDGILAILTAADRAQACAAALAAAIAVRSKVAALNERRVRGGLPVTEMYLGLHAGEVFYGNIGSTERLDFTVLGPAVNETSRIAAMCRSVEQPVLVSEAFANVGVAASYRSAAMRCAGSRSRKSFSHLIARRTARTLRENAHYSIAAKCA